LRKLQQVKCLVIDNDIFVLGSRDQDYTGEISGSFVSEEVKDGVGDRSLILGAP